MQPVSLAFSGRNLIPDVCQVFDGNTGTSAFCLQNKLFGDVMVHPCLKSLLPSRKLSQSLSGSFGPFLLENSSSLLVPKSVFFDGFSGEDFSIGICGDVDDSEIHTKDVMGKFRFLLGNVTNDIQKPFLVVLVKDKINFSLTKTEVFSLMLPTHERDFHPARKGPQADLIPFLEREDSIIVRLCRPFTEDMASRSIGSVRIGNLGDTSNNHLGRKRGQLSQFMVLRLVQVKLSKILGIKGISGQNIANLVARLKRPEKNLFLLWGRFKFQVNCNFHNDYSTLEILPCQAF